MSSHGRTLESPDELSVALTELRTVDVSVEPFTSSFASATEGVQLVDSMGGLDEDGSPGDLWASLTAGAHHARFAH